MTFPTTGHSCGFVVPEDGSSPKFVVAGGAGLPPCCKVDLCSEAIDCSTLPPFGTVQIYYFEDDSWLLGNYKL